MNIPSASVLIHRDKLVRTVQDLCEGLNSIQSSVSSVQSSVNNNPSIWERGTGSNSFKGKNSGNNAACSATGDNSLAVGRNCTSSGESSAALNASTEAKGSSSLAVGFGTTAENGFEFAGGRFNVSNVAAEGETGTTADAHSTLFSMGNGAFNAPKNMFEIMKNGDVYVMGVGGYDGTNAGASGIKTLQTVLSDLA